MSDLIERDLKGETVCGFRVAAYRETHPEHGDKYGHSYSEHWSTPNTRDPRVKVERLFTEDQLRAALRSAAAREAELEAKLAHAEKWWTIEAKNATAYAEDCADENKRAKAAEAREAALVEALAFYASRDNWQPYSGPRLSRPSHAATDRGSRAREALAAAKGDAP